MNKNEKVVSHVSFDNISLSILMLEIHTYAFCTFLDFVLSLSCPMPLPIKDLTTTPTTDKGHRLTKPKHNWDIANSRLELELLLFLLLASFNLLPKYTPIGPNIYFQSNPCLCLCLSLLKASRVWNSEKQWIFPIGFLVRESSFFILFCRIV